MLREQADESVPMPLPVRLQFQFYYDFLVGQYAPAHRYCFKALLLRDGSGAAVPGMVSPSVCRVMPT